MKTTLTVTRCDKCHRILERYQVHYRVKTMTEEKDLCPACYQTVVSCLNFLDIQNEVADNCLFVQAQVLWETK